MFQADDLMPSSALARRDEYLWRITRTSVAGVVVIVVDLKAVEEEEEEEAEVVMVRIVDLSLYLTNPTVDIPPLPRKES
jgi:hypothetical protein